LLLDDTGEVGCRSDENGVEGRLVVYGTAAVEEKSIDHKAVVVATSAMNAYAASLDEPLQQFPRQI
jgi:hypothetical protein